MANQIASVSVELGNIGSPSTPTQLPYHRPFTHRFRGKASQFKKLFKKLTPEKNHRRKPKIEDYRRGYPRFAALLASHPSFHVFRRFSNLRTRLLLLKQDNLSLLEKKLNRIDQDDPSPLFLACSRMDRNAARAAVVAEIESTLAAYDDLMDRSRRMLSFESPLSQHVSSIENWLDGNGCIAREETQFLSHEDDLLTVGPLDDGVLHWLETVVTTCLALFSKGHQDNKSDDSMVHIFPRTFTNKVTRLLLTPLVIFFLLVPVMICNALSSSTSRLIILILAAVTFITAMSLLTKSKTIDLATCSATYLAVLLVFVSSPKAA
ncbi:hypothetical protein F4781DRAFT_440014 [Annulohypoxylon bovei var. microspora]|nr:hypothetical protein F4781DRAFT_440014 [Annulohypoxylon bovei var. microspora]